MRLNDLRTAQEVAKRLKVGSSTVRLWCLQGRFKRARQLNGTWFIPEADLKDFKKPTLGRPPKHKKVTRPI